ncbi:putative zn 2cys6 transcription factor [Erysiphe neolycopersici]|uniref:Putative zn 2cys6 transcription factor n=1 Tax=Erysiphe neolycopersici TaxID=212602 RepID=A0A420HW76_9PEZI|nr:putative zn 2cys6 transcription factor [Erysiphe neolycopersici]
MCSSSKIRCNKQKPICGRCERLGLQCLYSPARRIGRPNSLRGPQTIRPSTRLLRPRPPQQHFEAQDPPNVINNDLLSSVGEIKLSLKPEISSETSQQSNQSLGRPQERDSTIAHIVAQECVIVPNNSFGKQVNISINLLESSPNFPQSADDTLSVFETQSLQPNHGDDVIPKDCQAIDKRSLPVAPSQSLFCAAIAMKILAHLEMTSEKLESNALVEDYNQIQSYNGIIEIVMASLTPLSTILMCSCSKMLDIALLATSTCLAVLDILHLIIRKLSQYSKQEKLVRSSSASLKSIKSIMENDGEVHHVSSLKESIDSVQSKMMRELPKVAKLISLFQFLIENDNRINHSSELQLALVAEVKSKFQCLAKSIADW